jgi:hypothetical protein
MKSRVQVAILIPVIAVLIITGICATQKKASYGKGFYIPTRDDVIHGIWINMDYSGDSFQYQKIVMSHWGHYEIYTLAKNLKASYIGTFILVDKWIDTEGNTWYNDYVRNATRVMFELDKISNNGTIWEYVYYEQAFPTEDQMSPDSPSRDFPTEDKMNPDGPNYHIYYRQE